jgi:hypothetical protein
MLPGPELLSSWLAGLFARPGRMFNVRTWQPGPFALNAADPTGTLAVDSFTLEEGNDDCALVAFDFNLLSDQNVVTEQPLAELYSWTPVVRYNDGELLEGFKAGPALAVTTLAGYVQRYAAVGLGNAGNKSDFLSGRIPVLNRCGPGGKITVGARKTGIGGTYNWTLTGVLYFIVFPYHP